MLEENVVDTTYIEDFLLTYRVFDNDPLKICTQLLEWFDVQLFRDKVSLLRYLEHVFAFVLFDFKKQLTNHAFLVNSGIFHQTSRSKLKG